MSCSVPGPLPDSESGRLTLGCVLCQGTGLGYTVLQVGNQLSTYAGASGLQSIRFALILLPFTLDLNLDAPNSRVNSF